MASTESTSPARPVRSLTARSPISPRGPVRSHHGWEVSGAGGSGPVRLADLTALTKVLVRGAAGSGAARRLDCPFGRTRRDPDGSLVIGAGPDEWLVLSPAGTRAEAVAGLESEGGPGGEAAADGQAVAAGEEAAGSGELLTVIDVTHGSVVLRLAGGDSARVLEKICAIDLSDRTTPDGSSFRSSVARLRCTVVRDDLGGERSYLIESDRSSGQYLFDAICDAGHEFAIEVTGYPDKEI